jgi:hypothetical protein
MPGGSDVVVLMVGCLVEFVKEFCNQETDVIFEWRIFVGVIFKG